VLGVVVEGGGIAVVVEVGCVVAGLIAKGGHILRIGYSNVYILA